MIREILGLSCTIIVKIEDYKAQVSVVHDGVTIFEFKLVDPRFTVSTFEFTGVYTTNNRMVSYVQN
jgi:hypothetical protein